MIVSQPPKQYQHEPDRIFNPQACELCGDDGATYLARVTEQHNRQVCYDAAACRQRMMLRDADMDARYAAEAVRS